MHDYMNLAYEAGKQQAQQEASENLEKLSQAAYEQGVAQALEDAGMSKEALGNLFKTTKTLARPTTAAQISSGLKKVQQGTARYAPADVIRGMTNSKSKMNISQVFKNQPELRNQIAKMRPDLMQRFPQFFPG